MTTTTPSDPASSRGYKCPCCNNPWSAATGEFFAKLCGECEAVPPSKAGLDRSNMDFDTAPSTNFYQYSNGKWLEKNPIPAGYPNWNSFLILHTQSQENLKNLLEGLCDKGDDECTPEERKVAAFFAAAMDEEAIEAAGVGALTQVLQLVDDIVDKKGSSDDDSSSSVYAQKLGTLALQYGVAPFFNIGVSPDNSYTDHSLLQVSQGGLGLPDRDYYFDEDKEETREAYLKTVALMLTMLEDPTATEATESNNAAAQAIFDLEKSMAEKHMTKTENRDPHATYNKMSIANFVAMSSDKGSFAFGDYFEAATTKKVADLGDINVRNVEALKKVGEVASSVDASTLASYLRWHVVKSCAPYLSKAFVQTLFDFYEKTLMGTQEMKPRWKRAMAFTESAIGEALGKLYCAKYFEESSKERALKVVEQVRQALEARLMEVEWMTADETRNQALKKMASFGIKIGYPDKWTDYSSLEIDSNTPFMDMVFRSREFDSLQDVKEMNAPTDRAKWFMTPQTINAYYHPNLNEIVFPAAILQPPLFDEAADDAVNFGAMGAVIGHEMTHGFDDKGRKFNYAGILSDWWTEADSKEYESRVEVMVEQANQYEVHGQFVKGGLTSGENIADLGGLRLALRALKSTEGYNDDALVDGFTPTQRFFLSWAQCWRQNITKERSLQLLTLDPHGPNEMRCNGPLGNMAEFHSAFDVKPEDPMFVPADKRVDIW